MYSFITLSFERAACPGQDLRQARSCLAFLRIALQCACSRREPEHSILKRFTCQIPSGSYISNSPRANRLTNPGLIELYRKRQPTIFGINKPSPVTRGSTPSMTPRQRSVSISSSRTSTPTRTQLTRRRSFNSNPKLRCSQTNTSLPSGRSLLCNRVDWLVGVFRR